MVALPVGPYFPLLFLWHLSFFDGFMDSGKNIAISHCPTAITSTINLAGRQCSFINGPFFNRGIFHTGQSPPHAHSNSEGMESHPGLFARRDFRPLREYE